MSAGNSLLHEEHYVGDDEVNFFQIWTEPKLQNVSPHYQRSISPKKMA
jgi:redox-sensitive bicupin YhaK (pirin superfamily)